MYIIATYVIPPAVMEEIERRLRETRMVPRLGTIS